MAAKDSLVIGNIFGGTSQDISPATVQSAQKGRKAKKGATSQTLKKITSFFEQLTNLFVALEKTVKSLSKILVSLIGLVLIAAVLCFLVKSIYLGTSLPFESIIILILRQVISRNR